MIEPKPNAPNNESASGEPMREKADSFPMAIERPVGRRWATWIDHWGLRQTRMWWLTAACAAVALVLVATAWHSSGPRITIEFVEGHGLRPGDSVRLRGIDVGIVERVVLNRAL